MGRIQFLNPGSDAVFVAHVERLLEDAIPDPGSLQARLREVYPAAVVRERGLDGDDPAVWYVYRDGHWVSGEDSEGTG